MSSTPSAERVRYICGAVFIWASFISWFTMSEVVTAVPETAVSRG